MTDTPPPPSNGARSKPPADTPTPHTIRTDRPCAKCGFNLYGQPIVREPHYNLTAARCPECGQVAALQEYPALGKWADRWAKLLGALWILALLGAMFAQFGPTLGLGFAAIESNRETTALAIAVAHNTWQQDQAAQADKDTTTPPAPQLPGQNISVTYSISTHTSIDQGWYRQQAQDFRDQLGGRAMLFKRENLSFWFPLAAISFAFGAFWSTALLGASRPAAFAVACIPPVIAFTFVLFASSTRFYDPAVLIARDAAAELVLPAMLPATILIVLIPLGLGAIFGRKLARLLTRLALPPRMRTALAILWTRDNLPPPSAHTKGNGQWANARTL